jgi:hypothetical protein
MGNNSLMQSVVQPDWEGHRELRPSNLSIRSTSDNEAHLSKKAPGHGAYLSNMGHCVIENLSGLVVDREVTQSTGMSKRDAVLRMARGPAVRPNNPLCRQEPRHQGLHVYLRIGGNAPHVVKNVTYSGGSAIDSSTADHEGYA